MEKSFSSKALEVNLAKTRDTDILIPEDQKWFAELSKSYWGIYKRTQEFIKELNHQYINYQYVIENLHNISLTDLWFYNSLEESEEALTVLVNIFKKLFEANLQESQRELLITTLIKFIDRLAKLGEFPKSIIHRCLDIIKADIGNYEILYIRNSGYFKTYLNKIAELPEYNQDVLEMTSGLLSKCIDYWEETSRVEKWFQEKSSLFHSDNSDKIKDIGKPFFEGLRVQLKNASEWSKLCEMLFFNDISNYFRRFSERFDTSLEKIYYIFYLIHLPGMVQLKNHLLYDMNRLLRNVLKELDENETTTFLTNIMVLFEELKEQHTGTVLDCIQTLGKEVIDTGDQKIISYFIKGLIEFGFVYPGELTVNSDWQIQVNTNHVKNIRVWLELVEHSPETMKELLSALIVNLKLGGIFISDTDLFQRDVTKLLNSNIEPVFKQMKQLARIFPVYFRDIGAEGKLREVTTAVDELSRRKDRLIHFLRKQIHTESNNTHIELAKKIIQYWYDGNAEPLRRAVPEDVFQLLDTKSEWYVHVHEILAELCRRKDAAPEQLLLLDVGELEQSIFAISSGNSRDKRRVYYLLQLYSLLMEKYSLESENIVLMLKGYRFFSNKDIEELRQALMKNDITAALEQVYKLMRHLKKIIVDPNTSEALENIYYKRHVAIGIPSMYGQYIEPKFEALGLMFRLEKAAAKLMVELLQDINLEYISAKTFRHVYEVLGLFKEGLELDGIYNQGFDSNFEMFKYSLTSPSFSLDQYINIFQFMAQNVKQIIGEYFLDVYENPLKVAIPQIFAFKGSLSDPKGKQLYHMESEKFFREILSSAFLVQDLDNFITNLVSTLRSMVDSYSSDIIKNMMTYDPDLTISPLYKETVEMDNPVFLGAKAYFLKKMISYDFPIPHGFVLTTEVFRHRKIITEHPYMEQEVDQLILNHIWEIEKITKQQFGNPKNPLLFSVRSGTAISMPGAMRTFLNVGMNDEIAETFSKKPNHSWTAWDCYRRFIQSWGMAYGIERDVFDSVILGHKVKYGVEQKKQFNPEQMKDIAYSYKKVLEDYGIHIEKDPFKQLKQAILSVIDSWSSGRAIYYREHLQIADEWGTAVIVQKMALGNLSNNSGTGVVFTNSPLKNKSGIDLYGDFTLCSQGEDIVSGLVHTLPITESQRREYYSDCSLSLQSEFPGIYNALLDLATQLIETYGYMHQEIEFTFESDNPEDLYILQTRNQKLKKQKNFATFIPAPDDMKLAGRGIGIGGGALTGILTFDMEDLKEALRNHPEEKRILVRPDTVPDDIPLIFSCDGLITGKGGATSHAAVTAASLGKVCVVNCKGLTVNEAEKRCKINGVSFKSGDRISIDGNLGNVYEGVYDIQYE
ncbi:MAG: PEP/pyruvate-binding domain-containing protein [Clostridiaceae bacterium]|nr:PEP/pyruvate-binding domain-containing protein [Clostridiaceae bacterium]